MQEKEKFMKEAIKEAKKAAKKLEVPVRMCNSKKWRNNCKSTQSKRSKTRYNKTRRNYSNTKSK